MDTLLLIVIGIAALNVASFACYGIDKRKARVGSRRFSERFLMLCAVFGAVGALLGMRVFHHKTRKPLFRYGVPLILFAKVLAVLAFVLFAR